MIVVEPSLHSSTLFKILYSNLEPDKSLTQSCENVVFSFVFQMSSGFIEVFDVCFTVWGDTVRCYCPKNRNSSPSLCFARLIFTLIRCRLPTPTGCCSSGCAHLPTRHRNTNHCLYFLSQDNQQTNL